MQLRGLYILFIFLLIGVLSARSQESVLRTDIDPRITHSITGVTLTDDGSRLHKRFANINVHFKHDDYRLYLDYMGNEASLENFAYRIETIGLANIDSVVVISQSSPEGVYEHNVWLSKNRAGTMRRYLLDRFPGLSDRLYVHADGESWQQLREYVKNDSLMKNSTKEKVIKVIDSDVNIGTKKWRLEQLPIFRYLYITYYPRIRNSAICILYYSDVKDPVEEFPKAVVELDEGPLQEFRPLHFTVKKTIAAVKTNLLYDAVTALNVEVEVPIGDRCSVMVEDVFPWWNNGNKWAFQMWEMGVEGRYWFKRTPARDALTGHFVGVYGMSAKYDFQKGRSFENRGEYWSAGVTYGYSMPLGKYFNFEFSASFGYARINYRHYTPSDGYDDLIIDPDGSGRMGYIGPTKLKASLVFPITIKRVKGGGL